MKNILFVLFFYVGIAKQILAVNKFKVDSLETELIKETVDSNRIKIIFALAIEYKSIDSQKSSNLFYEALALTNSNTNSLLIYDLYTNIALINYKNENNKNAIRYFNKSLVIAKEKQNYPQVIKTYIKLGNLYRKLGDYKNAANQYYKAIPVCEKNLDYKSKSSCYLNISAIFLKQNYFNEALIFVNNSLKLNQKINNQLGIASDYNIISNIYSKKNNIPTAIEYNKKALKIWIKEKEMYGTAGTYNNIGLLYHNVGNFEEAIKFYKEGLSIFTKLENKEGMAGSLNNLSSIFIKQRKYKLANLYLLQSLNISKEIKSLELMRENYNEFYNLEYSNGNYKMAIEYLNIYIQIKDSLANENNVKNLLKLQIQHEYDNKETTLMNEQLRKDFKSKIEIRKQKVLRDSFVGGFALMLILAGIIFRSYRIKQKANHIITLQKEEVEKQRNIVVHQKQEILDSIEYAKRIQTTILPPPKVVKKYLDDSFILYLPKDIVAGDFYWMETVGDWVLFAACDCTGHGVPGALVSVVCHNALNRAVKEYNKIMPAEILDVVAELVLENFSSDDDVKDGMDASVCALNTSTGELYWAGANNPLWLIRHAELDSTSAETIEFKPNKQPIGKFDDRVPYTNHKIEIAKGDTIYLFTDGYADQFGGERGKKLTKAKFKEAILNMQRYNLDEQKKYLLDLHLSYKGTLGQVDDICVIGVRV